MPGHPHLATPAPNSSCSRSGAYKPVERFSEFVNVPELIDIFRSVADVVQKADLRGYLKLPALKGGQRQLITAPASEAFRDYQRHPRRADHGDRAADAPRSEGR